MEENKILKFKFAVAFFDALKYFTIFMFNLDVAGQTNFSLFRGVLFSNVGPYKKYLFNWAIPGLFFSFFCLFKQQRYFKTMNVKMIQCWY